MGVVVNNCDFGMLEIYNIFQKNFAFRGWGSILLAVQGITDAFLKLFQSEGLLTRKSECHRNKELLDVCEKCTVLNAF
jgi:hypothetical protein